MNERHPTAISLREQLISYKNIIYALMMHDIKNRFFGSGLGQIVMILWPFIHIMVLITIFYVTKRTNPYGESLVQWSAVSIFPFICFNYVSRWICFSASTNKGFLNYPILRPLDILVARTLLEIVSISIVAIMLLIFVTVTGSSVMPADPAQAVYAVLATIFLAIGMGFINAPAAFIISMWNIVMTLLVILAYTTSGIIFLPSALPEQLRYYLSWNPLLNCTEWMRAAYYSDYPTTCVDKLYVMEVGLTMLTLGLIGNRLFRRFY